MRLDWYVGTVSLIWISWSCSINPVWLAGSFIIETLYANQVIDVSTVLLHSKIEVAAT